MGWRNLKLTIPDCDLARCSELSATEQARRPPTLGIILIMRQHHLRVAGLSAARACSRLAGPQWGLGRAVTARCLCSDSRGLGIRSLIQDGAFWSVSSSILGFLFGVLLGVVVAELSGCGRDGIGPFEDDWLDPHGQHACKRDRVGAQAPASSSSGRR